jgi:MFS family permease
MLDVRFFRNPRFSAASATVTVAYFALFACTFLLTQYFQFRLGYSPVKAGLMLTPVAIGLMVGGPIAPRFVARHGTTKVVVFGLCTAAFATACYASDTLMSSFTIGFLVRLVYGLGMAATVTPVTESIMGSLPKERAGVGSAMNDTSRQTGGALGVAVLGSVFASHFHSTFTAPAGLPAAAAHTARDSIGVALEVARHLPAPLAAALRHAAQTTFLSSARITFILAALVILGAAGLAARFLPARAAEPCEPIDTRETLSVVFADEPV